MTIALTHPALRRAVTDLDDAAERLRADEERVDGRVRDLLDARWTGRAADAFGGAWQRWRSGADDVLHALEVTRDLLAATHDDLSTSDEDAAGRSRVVALRLAERPGDRLVERLG